MELRGQSFDSMRERRARLDFVLSKPHVGSLGMPNG